MNIRKIELTPGRLKRLKELDALCFADDSDPYWFEGSGKHYWGVYDKGKMVAYAVTHANWLSRVGVLRAYRGMGLQQTLIKRRIHYLKRMGENVVGTYTHYTNTASMISLMKCGFVPTKIDAYWWISFRKVLK